MLRPLAVLMVMIACTACVTAPAVTIAAVCRVGEAQVETQLFFGMSKRPGGTVSEREWQTFVAQEIVPRFPEGFSVIEGAGYWRDRTTQRTLSEKSKVVLRVHGANDAADIGLNTIMQAYKTQFQQDAVLRVDRPVCAAS